MKIKRLTLKLLIIIFLCPQDYCVKAQDLQWFNQIKDIYDDSDINEVVTDSLGNIYIGGSYDDQKSLGVDNSATAEVDFMGTVPASNTHEQMGFLAKLNSGGVVQWIKKFGSPSSTIGYSPLAMVIKNGFLYAAGSFGYLSAPGMDFDPDAGTRYLFSDAGGNTDFFVSKYNASTGALVWAYAGSGSAGHDLPIGISVDNSENIYLLGQIYNGATPCDLNIKAPIADANQVTIANKYHLYFVKYDKDCNFQWRKNITNSLNSSNTYGDVDVDIANSVVYIAGGVNQQAGLNPSFVGASLTVDATAHDGFLAKYDFSGTLQWVKNIASGTGANDASDLDIDGYGNIYVGGVFTGTADFDPSAGTSNLTAVGSKDGFVAKYNSSGTRLWSYKIGSTAYDYGIVSLQVTPGGNLLVGGNIADVADVNPEGTGGAQNKGIAASQSVFFGEYDKDFKYRWAYAIAPTAGTNGNDNIANGVAIDKFNEPYPVYIYGYMGFTKTQNFNPSSTGPFGPGLGPQTSTGAPANSLSTNGFLAKYSSQFTLPIDLTKFTAACKDEKVIIDWQVASQTNNDYFTIERTTDGIVFNTIGTVQGAGNATQSMTYTFIDAPALIGKSYYRLRQTDFDGQTKFFNLVSVSCNDENSSSISLRPNPATNELSVCIDGKNEITTVFITDIVGQIVLSTAISADCKTKINIEQLAKGIYFVSLFSEKIKTIKFIKL